MAVNALLVGGTTIANGGDLLGGQKVQRLFVNGFGISPAGVPYYDGGGVDQGDQAVVEIDTTGAVPLVTLVSQSRAASVTPDYRMIREVRP